MVAQAALRLGWSSSSVVDILLMDVLKNRYTTVGHNYQGDNLPAYYPGNGGLLLAIAMMASGTTDGRVEPLSFPSEWNAQAEGFLVQYP